MIEFYGEIADKIRIRIMKKRNKHFAILALLFTIISVIATIIFAIINDSIYISFLICSLILLFVSIFFFISPTFEKTQRFKNIKWIYRVQIDEDEINYINLQFNQKEIIPLLKIKKVIDEGDCYHIVYSEYSNSIICQKDLITEGTIEEFEEIFKDKIVRKFKQ